MASIEVIRNSDSITRTTVIIDSAYRTSGTSSRFTYDLGVTLESVKLIDIKGINFVNVIKNVNENNNGINWVDGLGVTHNNEIPIGNYSDVTLCRAISTLMTENTSASEYYICSIDRDLSTFVISNGTGNAFDLNFGISSSVSIGTIIGLGTTNYLGITTITGSEILNLTSTKAIYVGSTVIAQNATDNVNSSNGVSNVLERYNVGGIFGSIIVSQAILPIKQNNPTITEIDISLFDDLGRELLIPNDTTNGYFNITLDIYSGIFDLTFYD